MSACYYKKGGEIITTGEKIRLARKREGLTQKELAEILGIPYQGISQYERGIRSPKFETLSKIGVVLQADVWELMGDEELEKAASISNTAKRMVDSLAGERISLLGNGFFDKDGIGEMIPIEYNFDTSLEVVAKLKNAFDLLNEEGQQVAIQRIEELTEIPKYRKE